MLTFLWLTSTSPREPPGPVTTFSTPAGKPACCSNSASLSDSRGVSLAGLRIIALPASSAGKVFQAGIAQGKFPGGIVASEPDGRRKAEANLLGGGCGVGPDFARRLSAV